MDAVGIVDVKLYSTASAHPSVIGQIATQPTILQKPLGVPGVPGVPVAGGLKNAPVNSTIPESTKLQELFSAFRVCACLLVILPKCNVNTI